MRNIVLILPFVFYGFILIALIYLIVKRIKDKDNKGTKSSTADLYLYSGESMDVLLNELDG